MNAHEMERVVCLTSHDRIDCARINQEIVKYNYKRHYGIVHASSNAAYRPYLEDMYVACRPGGLHDGAVNLLQQSIKAVATHFRPRYIVHLEADTWLLDERVLDRYIGLMDSKPDLLLCTSGWSQPSTAFSFPFGKAIAGLVGISKEICDLATQFFILRNSPSLIECILDMRCQPGTTAETEFFRSFTRRFGLQHVLRMYEREPVHPRNRYFCKKLALYCQHWPAKGTANDPRSPRDPLFVTRDMIGKKEALLQHPDVSQGEHLQRLLNTHDYDYYNPGALRY